MSSSSAFNEHQQWLQQIHEAHQAHFAKPNATRASSLGVAGFGAAPVASAPSPLPTAPMQWAQPEEANEEVFDSFAGIALADDDFDAPVYRSLDGIFSSGSGCAAYETGEEEAEAPVYRGLAFGPEMSAEEQWLASMPPLISRQAAHGASLAGPVLDLGLD